MTTLQQAQELLAKLPEQKLAQTIKFMTGLLNQKSTTEPLPKVDSKELQREFAELLERSKNYPEIDIETARQAAMNEKYGKYLSL